MPFVELISVAPVKCFRLSHPKSVELTEEGVLEDRRFLLIDGDGRRLRSSLTSWPAVLGADYDPASERLRIAFPDGEVIEASALGRGEPMEIDYHGRPVGLRVVPGAWERRLAEMAGHPVRIARPETRGLVQEAPVTLVSEASVDRLARAAGDRVDGRRFRMLFTISGCPAHAEEEWKGRRLRIGDAVVRAGGPVERCAVTTRDPDTGARDLDTLRLIKDYRGLSDRGTIDFGVYADMVEPGRVEVGDTVEPIPARDDVRRVRLRDRRP